MENMFRGKEQEINEKLSFPPIHIDNFIRKVVE